MFDDYSHFLSYGASDQQTARDLTGDYNGLLVPGTIASFQADGTKGFVLTLSATSAGPKYAVDPRFPLFQQALPTPKRVHRTLADVFGVPSLVQPERELQPHSYTDELVKLITENWLRFNQGFTELELKKFDKYAARLDEPIIPANRKGPTWILPPYFVAMAGDPRWSELSDRFWHCAQDLSDSPSSLVRVVAVDRADLLGDALAACPETRVAVWVSDLDERKSDDDSLEDLVTYGSAIQEASARGQKTFALYGGFFAVLLGMFGLSGSSHGIGYGEFRAWEELPQSGPPPLRYYVPKAHRYVSLDLAIFLWSRDSNLIVCHCSECHGRSPAQLDYVGLMKHSVRCRAEEIRRWISKSPDSAVSLLSSDAEMFEDAVASFNIPPNLRNSADQCSQSLRTWASAISSIAI
jgi:hypothetical protein